MPYVNIKIVKEGVTSKQKEQLVTGISKLLNEVLNKDPQETYVEIDEVDTDNWGVGYETVTQIQARRWEYLFSNEYDEWFVGILIKIWFSL